MGYESETIASVVLPRKRFFELFENVFYFGDDVQDDEFAIEIECMKHVDSQEMKDLVLTFSINNIVYYVYIMTTEERIELDDTNVLLTELKNKPLNEWIRKQLKKNYQQTKECFNIKCKCDCFSLKNVLGIELWNFLHNKFD